MINFRLSLPVLAKPAKGAKVPACTMASMSYLTGISLVNIRIVRRALMISSRFWLKDI